MKKTIFFFGLFLLLTGCNDYTHPTIPTRDVDFYIFLDDSRYQNLLNYGGYVYLTGGVNGLIVYRLNQETFMCYDRACPYDWQEADAWIWMNDDGLTLKCTKCGSIFNILDGTVVTGPAQYPLKYYRTAFDGFRLRIYN
jgi:nitrite reductase/ring-hydroxylating ferredoxin subunit